MPDLHISAAEHAEFVSEAIDRLAPRWTTWTLQTIQQHGQMRFAQIASALPWLGTQNTQQVLRRMQTKGLLDRPRHGVYEVSPRGRSARNAHRALASWHRAHFAESGPVLAEAERTEDALRRLRGKGAVDVLHALSQQGPLPNGELRQAAGLATGSFHYRVQQLQEDQLLTRTGPSNRAYDLTPAAHALGPVYAELAAFESMASSATVRHNPTTRPTAGMARAKAAVRRTPSAFPGLFSHAPEPQPRVPAHVTALSRPSRTR
ncbi:winged helix-turn-helix transcriptional regulator [Streptomyces sp. 2314.4]|uniref:winged helix-turn-helix transcriptional regulator n=1 Tax=Streptomyces sp. 2314.4 TaxID=1881025 RepID=UPI000896E67C|nr:winged helix-turn-helix transcriptional regulator [Streptomyces sp. 2314.4]SEC12850.1 transcriptional regulator, HxlR family [Streptomyces sp. 2314.4]